MSFQTNLLDGWSIKLMLFSAEHHPQHHLCHVDVLKSKKNSENKLPLSGHQLCCLEHPQFDLLLGDIEIKKYCLHF